MGEVEFHFDNKNFVVVGASSGIGREIALDLAKSGARVLAVGRSQERLEAVKDKFPDKVLTASIDVLTAGDEEWEKVLAAFVEKYGKVNGAVYTAGITRMTPIRDYDEEIARSIVDTSFWGLVRFLHIISKKKYAIKGSSYVTFSSIAAYCGVKGAFAYTAAKGAVRSAVRTIAKEISRDGHRINSLSPGWVCTEMTVGHSDSVGAPPDEMFDNYLLGTGQPKDISGIALFLLSDAAGWITGADIIIDGGGLYGKH